MMKKQKTQHGGSASSDAPPNRPQFIDFGRESHVTASALHKIFKQIREQGMPDAISRSTGARQRHAIACQSTFFGPLVREVEVNLKKWKEIETACAISSCDDGGCNSRVPSVSRICP